MKEILKKSRLFSSLDDKALAEVASAATLKKAAYGELIFQEGEPAHSFYVVGNGKVKIYKMSPDGKEQVLMVAQPGDSFAEAALFAGRNFPASAQTLEDTELAVISRARFVSLLGSNPDLAVSLIARLSELLRLMTRLIEGLALSDVTTRLARYLTALRVESSGDAPYEVMLAVKKSLLAAQLGTIPETLSRSFSKLVKDRMIQVNGPTIKILDPSRLQRLADSGK